MGISKFGKLGVEVPKAANTDAVTSIFNNSGNGQNVGNAPNGNRESGGKTAGLSSIVGRNQTKNIRIHVQNLGSNLTINVKNAVEGAEQVGELIQREIVQALNVANQVQ